MCLPCQVWPGAAGARGGAAPHRDTAARTPGPGTCARSWTGSPVSAVQDGASIGIFSESRWAIARLDSAQARHQLSDPRQRLRRVPSPWSFYMRARRELARLLIEQAFQMLA